MSRFEGGESVSIWERETEGNVCLACLRVLQGQSELGKECGCRCGQNSGVEWDEGSDVGLKALGRFEHE